MVKLRSRCGVLFDGELQGQRVQVKRKKDRITAKNETGWFAIIVVDGKQKLAVPIRKEAQAERYRCIATALADRLCQGGFGSLLELTAARGELLSSDESCPNLFG